MKITPAHLAYMREAITPLDTADARAAYAAGNYPRADVTRDPDKRYRWDLFRAARLSAWLCDEVYPYADDTHVDTALRAIVAPLDKP